MEKIHLKIELPTFYILILYLLQFQYGNILCAKQVFVFSDHFHKGNNTGLNISKCANLPDFLVGEVTAVDTRGNCVQFFAEQNCKGKSIEMLPRSPSHHNLGDWKFNDMMKSAGPCRDQCSVNVTGPLPPKIGLNISIYDRRSYRGATQVINVNGCTIIPRKFNYRVLSINTTSNINCFQLYNNVECKSDMRGGYDTIEIRPDTPFNNDISRWLIGQVKAISHCSFKCNKANATNISTEQPSNENEVIIYDEPKFSGNLLRVNLTNNHCVNLDQFNGWEGAANSVKLYKNESCVMLYAELNCTGDLRKLNSSLEDMSTRKFSAITRSILIGNSCQDDAGFPAKSKALKSKSRWVTVLLVVIGMVLGAAFLIFVVGRWWYPQMRMGTSMFQICRGNDMGISPLRL